MKVIQILNCMIIIGLVAAIPVPGPAVDAKEKREDYIIEYVSSGNRGYLISYDGLVAAEDPEATTATPVPGPAKEKREDYIIEYVSSGNRGYLISYDGLVAAEDPEATETAETAKAARK